MVRPQRPLPREGSPRGEESRSLFDWLKAHKGLATGALAAVLLGIIFVDALVWAGRGVRSACSMIRDDWRESLPCPAAKLSPDFRRILASAKLGAPVQTLIQVAGNPARLSRRENGWNGIFSLPGSTLVVEADEIGAIQKVTVLRGNANAYIHDADNAATGDALTDSGTKIDLPVFQFLIETFTRPMRHKMATLDDYAFSHTAMKEKGLKLGFSTIGEVLGPEASRWIEGSVCELMANFGNGTCVIEAGIVCNADNYTIMLGENDCTGQGDPDGLSMRGAEEIAKAHGLFLNLSSGFWDDKKWRTPSGIKAQAEIYRKAFSRIVVSKIEYARK